MTGLLAWPAIYNGLPFLSPDTSAYIRGFDAGMVWLFDLPSSWTSWAAHAHSSGWTAPGFAEKTPSLQSPDYVIAGRSIAYGAILYIGELLGALWATVFIQALVALAAIILTLRRINFIGWSSAILAVIGLVVFTSLPFFVSLMLPDIFAGLALLGIANVVAFGNRMSHYERLFWLCLLSASVIFHPSHLAMVLAVGAVVSIAWLAGVKVARVGLLVLLISAGIGIASELMFNFAVAKILGTRVSRPPVIAARLIADGPGAAYLQQKCPTAGLVMCEYVDRLLPNSDAFLWDTTAGRGVFQSATIVKRREMAMEQYRFAAAVFAFDPLGQLRATLDNGFQQLTMIGLMDLTDKVSNLPEVYERQNGNSSAGKGIFPLSFFSNLSSAIAFYSGLLMAAVFIWHRKRLSGELKLFCAVVLAGQIANALICGALSGPHERYQARLAWLLPFTALIVCHQAGRSRAGNVMLSHSPDIQVGAQTRRDESHLYRGAAS